MRKSNPFVAIPTVPTTVSGQWLTYSHMANHYRRLLNVKPRVQTNAPRKPSSSTLALQASTMKLVKKLSSATSSAGKVKGRDSPTALSRTALRAVRSVPGPVAKVSSYQILFDQSELNNLSEAVMSDTDGEDEPSCHHQMPISEKINLYLDQLQDPLIDDNQSLRSSVSHFRVASKNSGGSKVGLGRHSRCFMPHVQAEKPPRQKPPSKTSMTIKSNLTPKPKKMAVGYSNLPKPKESTSTPPTKLFKKDEKLSTLKSKQPKVKNARNFSSPNSGSIGSIAGSDYLTEKRFMTSLVSESNSKNSKQRKTKSKSPSNARSSAVLDQMLLSGSVLPDWLATSRNSIAGNSNSINTVIGRSKIGSPMVSSSSVVPGYVNKDSSRDSAYGFSSGESKITTRESTPEKRKSMMNKKVHVESKSKSMGLTKYKSNLSTVASSINQELSQSESVQISNPKGTSASSVKGGATVSNTRILKPMYGNCPASTTNDKYINFITAVTDDIIKREVFTNKGLKSLFMAHVEANKDLELERMMGMLDKLRMDVGIPKDDALDHMEFGYGSIKYSTTSFFPKYTSPNTAEAQNTVEFDIRNTDTDKPVRNARSVSAPGPTSDVSLRQIHRGQWRERDDLNSGDESSKVSSCSVSVANDESVADELLPSGHALTNRIDYRHEQEVPNRDSDVSTPPSSTSSGLSLTESEIQRALGQAGFRNETALDIARITKQGRRKHGFQKIDAELPLELEPNNNKPLGLDGLKSGRLLQHEHSSSRSSASSVENA